MILISIADLRNSPALQDRVTMVEDFLKEESGLAEWPQAARFPAEVVRLSNTLDDYGWVLNRYEGADTQFIPGMDDFDLTPLLEVADSVGSGKTVEACRARIEAFDSQLAMVNPKHISIYKTPLDSNWSASYEEAESADGDTSEETSRNASRIKTVSEDDDLDEEEFDANNLAGMSELVELAGNLEDALGVTHPAYCVALAVTNFARMHSGRDAQTRVQAEVAIKEAIAKLKRTQRP